MAHIHSLPTEILDLIMCNVSALCMRKRRPTPSRALFPLNVAMTCTLWLNILKSNPRLWRRVVIDVAANPTPFLDMLALHDDDKDIIVFSSLKTCGGDAYQRWEMFWVRTIFARLEKQLENFRNITFDLVHQSSLPPAFLFLSRFHPNLTSLSLTCAVYDLDDNESELHVNVPPIPHVVFSRLRVLSLTGYAFMQLHQLGAQWRDDFKGNICRDLQLTVSHFTFHRPGRGRHNNTRSIVNLMDLLSDTAFLLESITLFDFSLNYLPMSTRQEVTYTILTEALVCDSVSREFLTALFSYLWIYDGGISTEVHFRNCSIPPNAQDIGATPHMLYLEHIPFAMQALPQARRIMHPHVYDDSLENALDGLHAHHVHLTACSGVTDAFLERLAETTNPFAQENIYRRLETLTLVDCTVFSSRGVRALISHRRAMRARAAEPGLYMPLAEVVVSSRDSAGPVLHAEDAAWFRKCGTKVVWTVGPDVSGDDDDDASDSAADAEGGGISGEEDGSDGGDPDVDD